MQHQFIHSVMHAFNKSILVRASHAPINCYKFLHTHLLLWDLPFSVSRIHKGSLFPTPITTQIKNNLCHLRHQKKKSQDILYIGQNKSYQSLCRQLLSISVYQALQQVLGTQSRMRQHRSHMRFLRWHSISFLTQPEWGRMSKIMFKKRRWLCWILQDKENNGQWALFKCQTQHFKILNEMLHFSVHILPVCRSYRLFPNNMFSLYELYTTLSWLNKCLTNSLQEKALGIVYLSGTTMNLIFYLSKE